MATVYVFRGSGKMSAKDSEAFRAAGWKVSKYKHGLELTDGFGPKGKMPGTVLRALNRAGFWWEVRKNAHNPSHGCCAHHAGQLRAMPKAKAKAKPKAAPRKNPEDMGTAKKKAAKKASAWYSNPDLETRPRIVKRKLPSAFVEVGTIAAIEYESDKFDGELRLYRHEVTRKRKLLLSVDGSTMIVTPPFKITKRGIEG